MNLKKLFVILLALLVVFSFVACDGGGGGSDDNGSTNGDNRDNGGNNGDGDVDPPAVTWPVRYLTDNGDVEGSYLFIDFDGMDPSFVVKVEWLMGMFKNILWVEELILVLTHMEMALYRYQVRLGRLEMCLVIM